MKLFRIEAGDPNSARAITQLWNATCGPELSITDRFARFNLDPASGSELALFAAEVSGQRAGFLLASATTEPMTGLNHPSGWIETLAVLPEYQGRGIGSSLLSTAEDWLAERGCKSVRLGGGLHPFAPGLPVQLGSEQFFRKRGFHPPVEHGTVWDMAGLLDRCGSTTPVSSQHVSVRPLQAGEESELDAFLAREFPGRWRYEFQEHLRRGGRLADYLLLWTSSGIEGFCQITLEDSLRPMDRFYMHGLPRPWGQMGPIGISARCRGQGLGAALVEAGLQFLRAGGEGRGATSCVIDWTYLREFYAKFGFHPHREYLILYKEFNVDA